MWQITDHTNGRILAVLTEHWSDPTAREALHNRHGFGAAMDIAHELAYLGFAWHQDFDVHPAPAPGLPLPACQSCHEATKQRKVNPPTAT